MSLIRSVSKRRALVVIAAAGLLVTGCGASNSSGAASNASGSSQPYQVLLLAPKSGTLAALGSGVEAGVRASVDVVNSNGGIDGRKIQLNVQDDKGDPAEVANLVNSALSSGSKPDFIIPGLTSTEVVAALPITGAAGVLTGSVAASASFGDSQKFPYFFSPTPLNSASADATVKKLKDAGFHSMALAVADNESGVASISAYQDAAKKAGISVTGVEKVANDAIDATPQLQRLRGGNPDVLVLGSFGPPNKPLLAGRSTLGWTVPVYGDNTVAGTNLAQLVPADALKQVTLVAPNYAVAGTDVTKTKTFQDALAAIKQQTGGSIQQALPIYLNDYRLLLLVKYMADKAGSTDAKKLWGARTQLKLADMPLYPGDNTLFTDKNSNFMAYSPNDYASVPAGPFQDGLIAPAGGR